MMTLLGPVIGAVLVLWLRDVLTTAILPVGIVTGLVFGLENKRSALNGQPSASNGRPLKAQSSPTSRPRP